MKYIRKYYGVPAKRGALVRYVHPNTYIEEGRITSAKDGRIRVKFHDEKRVKILHPTWNLTYL